MPIDASILLQQQRQPSILDAVSQAVQMKSMLQYQRQSEMAMKQQQRALDDEEAGRSLFAANPAPAPADVYGAMGVRSGTAALTGISNLRNSELETQTKKLKLQADKTARLGSLAGVGSASHEAAVQAIQQAVQEGLIPAEEGLQLASMPPGLLLAKMKAFAGQAMTVAQQRAQELAEIEARYKAAEEARKAAMAPLDFQAKQQAVTGTQPITPYQSAQLKVTTEAQKRQEAQAAETARHNRATEARMAEALAGRSAQAAPLGGGDAVGEEFLKTLPQSRQQMIRAMASGAIPAPSPNSRSREAQRNLADLMAYDPTFTVQRAQVRKAFATGPDGKNIGSLNTAIVHLGRLGDAGVALQNDTFVPGNEAYNYLRDKFGSARVTNFQLLKDAVAGEMAAALKGNATDIEIEKMGKSIRTSNSPAQLAGVVGEGIAVLADKAHTYQERYQREIPGDTWSPILPAAAAMLERHKVHRTGGAAQGGPGRKVEVWGFDDSGKLVRK